MSRLVGRWIPLVLFAVLAAGYAPQAWASPSCQVYKVRKTGTSDWQRWAAYGESAKVRDFMRDRARSNLGNAEVTMLGSYGHCGGKCCPKPGGHKVDMDFGAI
ncbi:MAG: hypothetical protein QGG40_07305 [Myxococcota bacterium]|jgi:hypothetical protein|nr:hypothetical protein [Myxococcota bacterium]